jgi:hypothetical protein
MKNNSSNSKFRHHKLSTDIDFIIARLYDQKRQLKELGYVHQLVFITPITSDENIELMFKKMVSRYSEMGVYYIFEPIYIKRIGVRTYFWFSFKSASERAAFVSDMEQRRRLTTGKLFYLDFGV